MYRERARRLLQLEGMVPLPELPKEGKHDALVDWLCRDPAGAEGKYSEHIGTFMIPVDVNLDEVHIDQTLDISQVHGQEYFFTDEKYLHRPHYRDARLLMR